MSPCISWPSTSSSTGLPQLRSTLPRSVTISLGLSFALPGTAVFTAGGDDGIRTHDPLLAGQVLSQLSYTPVVFPFARSLEIEQQAKSDASVLAYLSRILLLFLKFRNATTRVRFDVLHRKEVIQPHLPIRLPCYDLTPITGPTFDCCSLSVGSQASGVSDFHGLTGGVYKARERIHRGMLIRDY